MAVILGMFMPVVMLVVVDMVRMFLAVAARFEKQEIRVDFAVFDCGNVERRIDFQDSIPQARDVVFRTQVGFGNEDQIGLGYLRHRFLKAFDMDAPKDSVNQRDHAFQGTSVDNGIVGQDAVGDRCGIRQAGGFNQNARKRWQLSVADLGEQVADGIDQVAPDGTADASVFQQQRVFERRFNQHVIEADFAEFVDNQRRIPHSLLLNQIVDERGFAAAEKAGHHGNRNAVG